MENIHLELDLLEETLFSLCAVAILLLCLAEGNYIINAGRLLSKNDKTVVSINQDDVKVYLVLVGIFDNLIATKKMDYENIQFASLFLLLFIVMFWSFFLLPIYSVYLTVEETELHFK